MIGRTMGNLYRGTPARTPADTRGNTRADSRADDNLIPAEDVLNKNPSHVALGKLTHTNPRANHEPTNPRTHEPTTVEPLC